MHEAFKDLVAWQKAYQLALDIYRATSDFPSREMFGLTSQMQRAAISVPANIAEGYGRGMGRDFVRFLAIARGSLSEVETYLLMAKDLGYLDTTTYSNLNKTRAEVGRLIHGLRMSLQKTE